MYTSIGSCSQGVYLIVMVVVRNRFSNRKHNSYNTLLWSFSLCKLKGRWCKMTQYEKEGKSQNIIPWYWSDELQMIIGAKKNYMQNISPKGWNWMYQNVQWTMVVSRDMKKTSLLRYFLYNIMWICWFPILSCVLHHHHPHCEPSTIYISRTNQLPHSLSLCGLCFLSFRHLYSHFHITNSGFDWWWIWLWHLSWIT